MSVIIFNISEAPRSTYDWHSGTPYNLGFTEAIRAHAASGRLAEGEHIIALASVDSSCSASLRLAKVRVPAATPHIQSLKKLSAETVA